VSNIDRTWNAASIHLQRFKMTIGPLSKGDHDLLLQPTMNRLEDLPGRPR